ncbi:S9 family peptidase [Massilia sp. Leaf139]|uniref:alpha/beta hydrolase family protein n=1 Tax=Massilia sp. Leaf139 TaxID=1736272 RepID=UPI000701FC47|nr:alpha/beta fold hydrolase [Massilia sp. Leaf139]KQQ86525.1 hypothetical protein ASF77_19655 [Massilia sp. Leaf139]
MIPRRHRLLASLVCLLLLGAIFLFAWTRPAAPPQRPQTPSAPFPYRVHEVAFANASARLAGTLTVPTTPGPHPAIVLIPGSGEVDRDGALFGHQPYRVLADDLTRRGFAVLRSDKRGLGQSSGNFNNATTLDFADDIRTAVSFLRSRQEIDAGRIGLVGHSEGALIGTLVAGKDPSIAFLVLMAGNGVPMRALLQARGPQESSPWMRTLLTLDPQAALRQVQCPVLALVGEMDRVVTASENIPALRQALAGNPRAQVERLLGLNHFFQTAQTGEMAEVTTLDETISPQVLQLIGSWASRQVGSTAAPSTR